MRILFTGGGSGGHTMPIVAVARELRRLSPETPLHLHYIGPKDEWGFFAMAQEQIRVHRIPHGKLRRYFSFQNIIDVLFKIPWGFFTSFFLVLFIGPQLVFSKGGSGSVAVLWACRLLGVPAFIHESDTVPGLSNRMAFGWAKRIFVAFEKTEYFDLAKVTVVGNPIKKELLEGSPEMAREVFGLTSDKPVILFWGGSQGAQALNELVISAVNDLVRDYEIIHVCGPKNYGEISAQADILLSVDLKPYYHAYETLDEIKLKHALKVAVLVVSRAGSGSIFELAAAGRPSILVPLPMAAGDHQYKNAYQYAATGAAIIIEQENLTKNFFLGKLDYLVKNRTELERMSQAALSFAKPLAAKAIAREILEYLAK